MLTFMLWVILLMCLRPLHVHETKQMQEITENRLGYTVSVKEMWSVITLNVINLLMYIFAPVSCLLHCDMN